jgi:hypothetical protein
MSNFEIEFYCPLRENKMRQSTKKFFKNTTIEGALKLAEDDDCVPFYKIKENFKYTCNETKAKLNGSIKKYGNCEKYIVKMQPKYPKLNIIFNYKDMYGDNKTIEEKNISFSEQIGGLKKIVLPKINKNFKKPLDARDLILKYNDIEKNEGEFLYDLDWKNIKEKTLTFDIIIQPKNERNNWKI